MELTQVRQLASLPLWHDHGLIRADRNRLELKIALTFHRLTSLDPFIKPVPAVQAGQRMGQVCCA